MASYSFLILSFFKILQWVIGFYFFVRNILKFLSFAKRNLGRNWKSNMKVVESCPLEKLSDGELCMEEMKIVLDRLGIAREEEEEADTDVENWNIGASEFSEILLDEEPNMLEIKQVFEVFDENKDGFIDATELQRVLCGLCFKEGYELEECIRMLCAFDHNGDGLIDYQEFVVFMEKCFC